MRLGLTIVWRFTVRYTLLLVLLVFLLLSKPISAQQLPRGLWQSKEEGFVVRVDSCGTGFCGYAAGVPPGKAKGKDPKKACGEQMWHDFIWDPKDARWEGTVSPPDIDKSIKAFITTDGHTSLTMTAKIMFLTKTMNFRPFMGSVTESCEIGR